MSNLRRIIKEAVLSKGPISFARFMELALYCPNLGYYEQSAVSPGRKGDYFTSVSVGSLFGELLAFQLSEWLETMPGNRWQILEAGAHEGLLATDILQWFQTHRPDLSKSLEYWILEPSTLRRQCQEKALGGLSGALRWFNSWDSLPPSGINGFVVTNELLDALPTQRFGWDAASRTWFEWGVTIQGDDFAWARMPQVQAGESPKFAAELSPELLDVLPDGFTTEFCPSATEWWRQAAAVLRNGKLIAFDYGLTAEQFFAPERKEGTLRAYFRHHQSVDLLAHVGDQDLTAQVNFTAVREAGEMAGLKTESFVMQAQFLTQIVGRIFHGNPPADQWTPARVRQFQTLTHPEHLGNSFRVLVQSR